MLTQTSEAGLIVRDVRSEMDAKQASIKKTKSGRERKAIHGEVKELRKEYRERERRCVDTLIKGSKVVLATLHGAGGFQLKNEEFDVIIIDEASQGARATKTTQRIDGRTWTHYTGGRYDALVLPGKGSTTVVAGTGSFEQLTQMAGALKLAKS